ncbi:hypothetical protein LPA44_09690 [Halobacterium sp. KA-4]|uniref:hypothetical protein n=1 Tax=Halobacterium sp. KA-4 TaxID=2896367 RepID=UPI001E4C7718|nr:hypothetical protein [Halobacterium sp. KA-4]MCD2200171.1 hypothetical protein [Halobacterium sp. KA-4]
MPLGHDIETMTGEYPVHSAIDVIDGTDVYKNEEWWKAVIVYERYGRKVGVYLWHNEDGDWKRKQKYVIREQEDWTKDKAAIEKMVPLLDEEADSTSVSEADGSKVDELTDEAMDTST